jgi:hypothetical protein
MILLLSFTACVSDVERKKGEQDVSDGKKLINEYVKKTFGENAKASEFKPYYVRVDRGSTVPNFEEAASGCVKATVSDKNTKFEILYNLVTGDVLTNQNIGSIKDSFCTYANDVLQSVNIIDCSIETYAKDRKPYVLNFIKPDIKNCKELISTGEYDVKITFRSIKSDYQKIVKDKWETFTSLLNESDTKISILFVNYKDEEAYKAETGQYIFNHYFDSIDYDEYGPNYYSIAQEKSKNAKNIIYSDSRYVIDLKDNKWSNLILYERRESQNH